MPETIQEIIQLLESPDEAARSRGLERIAIEGGARALPWLLAAMKDESIRLRNKAKALILQRPHQETLSCLDDALRDGEDAGRRNAAMDVYASLGERSLPALCGLVFDRDEEVRNFACVLLGSIALPGAVPALVEALGDPDVNVSHAAAESLGKIGDPRAVGPLIDSLEPGDFWHSFPVIAALGEIGDERAVEPLVRCLGNELFVLNASQALGRIASPAALPAIVPLLASGEHEVMAHALRAVVSIQERSLAEDRGDGPSPPSSVFAAVDGPEFRTYLMGMLSSGDPVARRDAVVALAWLCEDRAVPKVIDLIKEDDLSEAALGYLTAVGMSALADVRNNLDHPVGMVRQALVRYLGSLGREAGAPLLRKMLADEMSIVRAQAALMLGKLCDMGSVDGLIGLLGDPNPEVQEAAIGALAELDPQVVCGKLVPYLKNSDPQYMFLAAETLGLLKAEEAVKPLSALLDDPRDIIREVAVKSIGRIGGKASVHPLLMSLKDESPRVRQQAIVSLGKVKDPLVLKKLLDLMEDPDKAVRYYVIRALRDQGSAAAVPALIGVVGGDRKNLVVAAVETLGSIGDASACDAITGLAARADRDLLRTAAHALGQLGCENARPALLALVSHEHWSVRCAAAQALGRVRGAGVFEALSGLLTENDMVVVKAAAAALGELGDRRAALPLTALINDEHAGPAACDALLKLGREAAGDIASALERGEPPLLVRGARILGELGGGEARAFLTALARHDEPAVRRAAAASLGRLGGPDALEELRRIEGSDDVEMVRLAARAAMGGMPGPEV